MKPRLLAVAVLSFVSLLTLSGAIQAQSTYPDRPIRMIIPFAAGGATDLHGRMLAARLQPLLKQTIIVEAKAGASGIIGTQEVLRSKPDGYTICCRPPPRSSWRRPESRSRPTIPSRTW